MKPTLLIVCLVMLLGCERRVISESTWGYDMFPQYQNLPRGESRVQQTHKAEQEIQNDANRFLKKLTPWK